MSSGTSLPLDYVCHILNYFAAKCTVFENAGLEKFFQGEYHISGNVRTEFIADFFF